MSCHVAPLYQDEHEWILCEDAVLATMAYLKLATHYTIEIVADELEAWPGSL